MSKAESTNRLKRNKAKQITSIGKKARIKNKHKRRQGGKNTYRGQGK